MSGLPVEDWFEIAEYHRSFIFQNSLVNNFSIDLVHLSAQICILSVSGRNSFGVRKYWFNLSKLNRRLLVDLSLGQILLRNLIHTSFQHVKFSDCNFIKIIFNINASFSFKEWRFLLNNGLESDLSF